MSGVPEQVLRMIDVLDSLPGVRDSFVSPQSLDGIQVKDLSLPGEFGDLPQVAIARSDGGLPGEVLIRSELRLEPSAESWLTLEFLAWWVRDWARSGHAIQIRPLALPPRTDHIQLGRTLKFVIEYFIVDESEGGSQLLSLVEEMANSIEENFDDYQDCFENPVAPSYDDEEGMTLDEVKELAASDASAAYEVARAYATGEGAEEDPGQAFQWYTKAAGLGHPMSTFFVGRCYDHGTGTPPDSAQALQYYQQAAEIGVPLALAAIGEMHMEGRGIPQDPAEGFRWFKRAADTGDPISQAELGDCYENGKGVDQDLDLALQLYQQSFDQGFSHVEPAIERVKAAQGLK